MLKPNIIAFNQAEKLRKQTDKLGKVVTGFEILFKYSRYLI